MILSNLSVHPVTGELLEAYVTSPSQGVLLHGDYGVGLRTVAQALAGEVNGAASSSYIVAPTDGSDISIDEIRSLYQMTRSKRDEPYTIIIDEADTMSIAAQNALLKLLEEPPSNSNFILTTHTPSSLLPTILSRIGSFEIRLLSLTDSTHFIEKLGVSDLQKKAQVLFLAAGRPAEMTRLIDDESYFENQATRIRHARTILEGTSYERLVQINSYTHDRASALHLLRTIGLLITHNLKKNISVYTHLEVIEQAINALNANANVRLQLLGVAVKLS